MKRKNYSNLKTLQLPFASNYSYTVPRGLFGRRLMAVPRAPSSHASFDVGDVLLDIIQHLLIGIERPVRTVQPIECYVKRDGGLKQDGF